MLSQVGTQDSGLMPSSTALPGSLAGSRIGGEATELKLVPVWNASIAVDGLMCCATVPAPSLI